MFSQVFIHPGVTGTAVEEGGLLPLFACRSHSPRTARRLSHPACRLCHHVLPHPVRATRPTMPRLSSYPVPSHDPSRPVCRSSRHAPSRPPCPATRSIPFRPPLVLLYAALVNSTATSCVTASVSMTPGETATTAVSPAERDATAFDAQTCGTTSGTTNGAAVRRATQGLPLP